MTDKKQLNEEQLNEVAGGSENKDKINRYLSEYSIRIDEGSLDNYVGQKVFFLNKGNTSSHFWIFGTLLSKVICESVGCGTQHRAKIDITDIGGGYECGIGRREMVIDGLYAYKRG